MIIRFAFMWLFILNEQVTGQAVSAKRFLLLKFFIQYHLECFYHLEVLLNTLDTVFWLMISGHGFLLNRHPFTLQYKPF